MSSKPIRDTIKQISVVHNAGYTQGTYNDSYHINANLDVWATTSGGIQVLVRAIFELDSLNNIVKVAMITEYFQGLIGHNLALCKENDGKKFFANEESLPAKFRASYKEIRGGMRGWIKANQAEILKRYSEEMAAKIEAEDAARRQHSALLDGLPEDSTWEQIRHYREETIRRTAAVSYGLSEDCSWEQIRQVGEEREIKKRAEEKNAQRISNARHCHLPDDSSWELIYQTQKEIAQKHEDEELKALEEQRKNALHLYFRKPKAWRHAVGSPDQRHDFRPQT